MYILTLLCILALLGRARDNSHFIFESVHFANGISGGQTRRYPLWNSTTCIFDASTTLESV